MITSKTNFTIWDTDNRDICPDVQFRTWDIRAYI